MATIVYDVNSGKPLVIGYVEETGVNQVRFDNFEPIRTDTTISLSIEGIGLLPVVNSTIDVTYTMTIAEGKTEAFLVEKNSANTIIRKSPPFMIVVKHNGRIAQFAKSLSMTIRDWFGTVVEELKRRITIVEGGLASEITRATNAEGVLTTNLAQETVRAVAAEEDLDTAISDEVTRAETAEATKIPLPTTAPTAADKILKVNTVNPLTTKWADETIFEETFFWVDPSTTTYAQITTAISNNKMPVMIYAPQNSGNAIFFTYAGKDTQEYHTFSSVSDVKYYEAKIRPDNQWQYGVTNLEKSVYKTNDVETYKTDTNHYPSTKGVADYVTTNLATKVDKTAVRDAGIKSTTYTQLITFTATTATVEGQKSPYALIELTTGLDKTKRYKVVINSVEHILPCEMWGYTMANNTAKVYEYLGNIDLKENNTSQGFYPVRSSLTFLVTQDALNDGKWELYTSTAGEYTVTVYTENLTLDKLPNELIWGNNYNPIKIKDNGSSTFAGVSIGGTNYMSANRGGVAIGDWNTINADFAYTLGLGNTVNSGGSVAIGRRNLVIGLSSVAEGSDNICAGSYCHAEGRDTVAYGTNHTEGWGPIAFSQCAHAEGWDTRSFGVSSHSEGTDSISEGYASHAEGVGCYAAGQCSHAGGYHTVATRLNQTVSGKCNIIDNSQIGTKAMQNCYWIADGNTDTFTVDETYDIVQTMGDITVYPPDMDIADPSYTYTVSGHTWTLNKVPPAKSAIYARFIGWGGNSKGTYATIVGNGTADNARSNAHTLDWSGNAWYQGTVECTGVIMNSPNGARWQLTVDDNGILSTSAINEQEVTE